MAFVDPTYKEYLDGISAADLQVYSNNNADMAGWLHYNQPSGATEISPSTGNTKYPKHVIFQYRARYLIYKEGDHDIPYAITSGGDSALTESLSAAPDGEDFVIYDLNDISWLVPGMTFIVSNVTFAFQSDYV